MEISKPGSSSIPKVIIIGGGFGGLAAAKKLAKSDVDITLIDRTNHHLFQPLLYQVATGGLSPANIAAPIRGILRDQKNVEVILAEARRVDVEAKKVITDDIVFAYDYLVLATGARHSYFGKDEWEKFAPGLKSLEDAIELRKRIFTAFEVAEKAMDPEEKRAAITFVVVGGGPTGVEMAGAIAEIARHTLDKDFRNFNPAETRVILVESGPEILSMFSDDLSASAKKQLEEIGVEVRFGKPVTSVEEDSVHLGDERIATHTIIWAAGNTASPLGKTLGVETDRAGRVIVREDLTIPNHPEVQVIGDMANFCHGSKLPVPGVCPAAMQMGDHAAGNIKEMLKGSPPKPFKYFDKGSMATIGRNKAVAQTSYAKFTGFPAWMAWVFIHIIFLVGFRSRIAVMAEWAWAYFTYAKGARLITGNLGVHKNLHAVRQKD